MASGISSCSSEERVDLYSDEPSFTDEEEEELLHVTPVKLIGRMLLESKEESMRHIAKFESEHDWSDPESMVRYYYRWMECFPDKPLSERHLEILHAAEAIVRAQFHANSFRFSVNKHPELLERKPTLFI
jgi:hypothetical protein